MRRQGPTPAGAAGALAPAVALCVLLSAAVALVSRAVAVPTVGTSPVVLVAMLLCVVSLTRTQLALGPGWHAYRRQLGALTVVAASYPGVWGLASLASETWPDGVAAWGSAVLAGVLHLPVLASFSLIPLAVVRYAGAGSARGPGAVVVGLGVLAAALFALFFDDFAPFAADALVASRTGQAVGAGVTAVFLGAVLVGPVVALLAAWSSPPEAARRLALAAASALAGAALVMVCGAVAASDAVGVGDVAVLVGMYAALAVVCAGTTRALATSPLPTTGDGDADEPAAARARRRTDRTAADDPGDAPSVPPCPAPAEVPELAALTGREAEVLALLAAGLSNAGIAARLVLSERTVDAHLRSVFTKLDLPEGPQQNRRVHAALRWADGRERDAAAG